MPEAAPNIADRSALQRLGYVARHLPELVRLMSQAVNGDYVAGDTADANFTIGFSYGYVKGPGVKFCPEQQMKV